MGRVRRRTPRRALDDLNFSATSLAAYALRLADRNLLAHGILARQYVVAGQRVRYTIAKHVDRNGPIKLPRASRSAGW